MATTYTIKIQTSNAYLDTGTDSTVYIQLIAKDGKTSTHWQILDLPWHNDFEPGATDVYNVKFLDIGMPSIIRIKLKAIFGIKDEWLCNKIEVWKGEESVVFPIYNYIIKEAEYASGEAKIPQKETCEAVKKLRKKEIVDNKKQFEWLPKDEDLGYKGFPRYFNANKYDDLPAIFRINFKRNKDIQINKLKKAISSTIGKFPASFNDISDFEEFDKLSKVLGGGHGDYLQGWDTDEGQGWQMLNGIFPLSFSICKEIPSYFNVTDSDLAELLEGKTIAEQIEAGKLYITDLKSTYEKEFGLERSPLSSGELSTCPPAVCLFNITDDGRFMPIAIQLLPNDRDHLFTSDGSHDWMLAKMYFRCATSNLHEWVCNFLYTHNTVEPFACSLFRCLSRTHPVYKLLRPHLMSVPSINTVSRHVLLTPNAKIASGMAIKSKSFIRKRFETYNINDVFIPKVLEKQGLDPEKIPQYWYGRDMLRMWTIIGDYVRSILHLYYSCDKDVVDDNEIQDWACENANEAFGWEDGNTRGVPEKFTTIEQLADLSTIIMVTSSAQYAAVNFGQFENYRFPPNSPTIMRLPPHKRGEATIQRIMDSLPNGKQSTRSVALTYVLARFTEVEEPIGTFSEYWFTEEKAIACQSKFKQNLEEFEAEIDERNSRLSRKYTSLKPSRIPNSIGN